jgi:hypothetical protein
MDEMIGNSVKQAVLKDCNRWKPTRKIVNSYAVDFKRSFFFAESLYYEEVL